MALTVIQTNYLLSGIERPETMTAIDMVTIVGNKHAQWFLSNLKETDAGTLAQSYKDKMQALSYEIKQKNGSKIISLLEALIYTIANILDYATIKTWGDAEWATNMESYIAEAFERVANVTNAEKSAYNALS